MMSPSYEFGKSTLSVWYCQQITMPTDSRKTIVPSSAGYIVHGPKGFACTICLVRVRTFIISISISLLPSNSAEKAKFSECVYYQ